MSVENDLKKLLEQFESQATITRGDVYVMLTRAFLEIRELKQTVKVLADD